jgi:hypothetical protein
MNSHRAYLSIAVVLAVTLFATTRATAQAPASTPPPVAAPTADAPNSDLAKAVQNPVGNLISVPFQDNVNLNVGPYDRVQNVLNIQPVIPIDITEDWNIITRTIVPIVSQPAVVQNQDRISGIGDIQLSAFLSPAKPGAWIWGAGGVVQAPTHTNSVLGNDHAGLGPSFVILHLEAGSPWVYGVLINNLWSVGNANSPSYSNGLMQPFLNYNFKGGAYLTSVPIITVNWQAKGSQQWTVPIGGGIGKIFRFGKLPVNLQFGGYYNVVRPDFAGNWQLRLQAQLIFPKK